MARPRSRPRTTNGLLLLQRVLMMDDDDDDDMSMIPLAAGDELFVVDAAARSTTDILNCFPAEE